MRAPQPSAAPAYVLIASATSQKSARLDMRVNEFMAAVETKILSFAASCEAVSNGRANGEDKRSGNVG